MASSRIIFAIASVLGVMSYSASAAMLPISQLSLAWTYDDNLNNAGESDQRISSPRWQAGWQRRDAIWRGGSLGLDSAAMLKAQYVAEQERLSHAELALGADLWWVTAKRFHAPSVRLSVQGSRQEFDSDLRDRYRSRIKLAVAQRLSTQLRAQIHVLAQKDWAASRAFSGRQMAAGAGLQWRILPSVRAFLLYQHLRQDVATSVAANNSGLSNSGLAWESDDALAGRWVYRLDSDGQHYQVGVGGALLANWHWSLRLDQFDLSARYPLTPEGRYAGDYRRRLGSLNLLWSY